MINDGIECDDRGREERRSPVEGKHRAGVREGRGRDGERRVHQQRDPHVEPEEEKEPRL